MSRAFSTYPRSRITAPRQCVFTHIKLLLCSIVAIASAFVFACPSLVGPRLLGVLLGFAEFLQGQVSYPVASRRQFADLVMHFHTSFSLRLSSGSMFSLTTTR